MDRYRILKAGKNKSCRLVMVIILICLAVCTRAEDGYRLFWHYTDQDTVTIEGVDQLQFTLLDESYKIAPLSNAGSYLFKLAISAGDTHEDRIVRIANPHLDTIYLYHKQQGAFELVAVAGNSFKKLDKSYNRFVQFTIPGAWQQIFLKTNFKKDVVFPVTVSTATVFNKSEQIEFFILGLYYGFVMMVIGINIFFYFIFRDRKYIYYCIFLFFIAFTLAYSDGLFALLTVNPWWLSNGDILVHLLVAPAGAIFATSFLEIDAAYPKAKWLSLSLVGIMLAAYAFHLAFGGIYSFLTAEIVGIAVLSFYWFLGVFRFNKDVFARFFVIAYGLILVFAFDFYMARKLGWNFLNMTHGQLKVASILEMVVLTWAITYRVKLLHNEHRYYKAEISRYMKEAISEDRRNVSGGKTEDEDVFERVKIKFSLSEREIEVLERITRGLTNSQIADQLFLSSNTVKFHIRNIYDKMEISSRAQAVSKLHEIG